MNPAVLSSNSNFLATFLASFLIWFLFLGLIYFWIADGTIKKEVVLHALAASLISWLIVLILKSLLPFPRPYEISGVVPLTLTIPQKATSFPSAHSSVAFAIGISVWLHKKKIGFWFIVGAFLVALGRIISVAHV